MRPHYGIAKRIQRMIKQGLSKTIAISNYGIGRKWKLTRQKPEREALEKMNKGQESGSKKNGIKIGEEQRRKWQAMLYFQDESGVSLTPVLEKTWAKKEKLQK